ncbi:MAG: hydrogenase expression protein [Dehalococcoidia bacterium]|nr:hydrogenase expression protein [Dehalococcoidia bacterium]MSQ35215.1 hydrogenase expression protein [Dehalococcoidia bacterium]
MQEHGYSVPGRLKAGKLPAPLLARLLSRIQRRDPRVLTGPGIGEDAALISFGASTLIAKTDPVTFATDLAGWYAVQVNANDIAVCGGVPKWFLATVLLPEGASPELAEGIFEQIKNAAGNLGVELVGGHTEVTIGLPRPIVVGFMLGEAPASRAISTSEASVGDVLVLTKGIAIEGTALLAREAADRLAKAGVGADRIEAAREFLFEPGISVVADARAALAAGGVNAMHDPTEGGLATALAEVAAAAKCGLEVDADAVPVFPETLAFCAALGADPWGLISSGALLISVTPGDESGVLASLESVGISGAVIGRLTPLAEGLVLVKGGKRGVLPRFERDEMARLLEQG